MQVNLACYEQIKKGRRRAITSPYVLKLSVVICWVRVSLRRSHIEQNIDAKTWQMTLANYKYMMRNLTQSLCFQTYTCFCSTLLRTAHTKLEKNKLSCTFFIILSHSPLLEAHKDFDLTISSRNMFRNSAVTLVKKYLAWLEWQNFKIPWGCT